MFGRHSTMSTIYMIYLQMSQETQFRNFEKKLIYIQKYSYIPVTYVLNIWFYLFNVSFICTYNSDCFIDKYVNMYYVLCLRIL